MFRVDTVCVISHDIWRYSVISCQVSSDITRYGISRYRIVSISRIFGTDIEVSYPAEILLGTLFFAS